jgi:stage II sporulation protein D
LLRFTHAIIASLFCLLFGLSETTYAGDSVRVRLAKNLKSVKLSGKNLRFGHNETLSSYLNVAIPKLAIAEVALQTMRPDREPFWAVTLERSEQDQLRVYSKELHVSGYSVRVGLEPVPSKIRLVRSESGRIDVITELDIETYLAGVLPSEMPAAWPLEALRAQAIASRTYMRKKMSERGDFHFDLEASVNDQVYRAMKLKNENPIYQIKVVRALRDTTDMVLKNEQGHYITAYYHSDCGGVTETPEVVWGTDGRDHQVVVDNHCKARTTNLWRYQLSKTEFVSRLASSFGIFEKPELESLFVTKRTPSDRVGEMSIKFAGHLPKFLSSQDFRQRLGFDKIKSTQFQWKIHEDQVVFSGKGNGHGVGMCQWGAKALALKGHSYTEILKHYYPKASLKKENWRQPEQLLQVPQLSKGWDREKAG